ncbi:MAG: 5,10-methylenetetrahydromethanopterin reductase [Candidatus Helarchaeota archaeon]
MVLRFGIEFVPAEKTLDVAYYSKLAENEGFDNVWVTDHFTNRSVFVSLTQVALYTSKIIIGTGVTNYYHINPAVIASSIATIAEISGGRTILGLGAGDKITLANLGIERKKPLTGMRESIDIIRRLWNDETVEYNGDVFKLPKAKLHFKVKHKPLIYMAAQGPKMSQLAAEMADGVLINASHPRDYEQAKVNFKIGMEKRDPKRRKFDVCAYCSFSIHDKPEKAQNAAKIVVAFIVGGSIPPILERHGIPLEQAKNIEGFLKQGKFKKAIDAVTPEMLDAFCIAGTPKDCIEKIEVLQSTGCTQLVCGSPLGPNITKAIKQIGKTVIPEFMSKW